jgi:asparagine synthase (glutamine-hydrolysing)
MCGLNGVFAFDPAAPAPTEAELIATRDHMAPRGPDGHGAWWSPDRRCGLGHRRLSIIDLSDRAAQPMTSADGRLVIVYNGEIYNFPELKRELETQGVRFRTTSDTECLLHLYAREGAEFTARLRGMFALAIWDAARGGMLLARDPYGIKPLYVSCDGRTVRFASQVKALLAGRMVSAELDPAGVAGFHLFGWIPEPFTLYRQIRALPAGCTQWVDASGLGEPRPYVSIPAILAEAARSPPPPGGLEESVRAAVLDSVRAHLLADVEVGAFLSAGVDSGALVGLMCEAGQGELRAITLAFDEFEGAPDDEKSLAAQTAQTYGARHLVRRVSRQEFQDDMPAILEAMDQPSMDGVNTWFVAKAAREAGLKVAVSGVGGDELLAGYKSFVDVPRWRRRFGPLAATPGAARLARTILGAVAPGLSRARPKALGVLEHAGSFEGAYLLRRGLFLPHELGQVMDPALAAEGLERLAPLAHIRARLQPDPGSDVGRVSALESTLYMRNQLLRDADWAGMAHSLEIRTPLVDIALLRALAPLIPSLEPGAGKAALARAPRVPLPDAVSRRAKTEFAVPTRQWMTAMGASAPPREGRGLTSRRWARTVFRAAAPMALTEAAGLVSSREILEAACS